MTRKTPTLDTIRALFARSGNQCAFSGCTHPIVNEKGKFIAQICHIEAAEIGGPRYNESQDDDERRAANNLIVMCYRHHVETDERDEFNVERLQAIKRELEFLNKSKPLGEELMSAKASLRAFLRSPNDRDWSNAWRHLVTMHSRLVDFTGSALWRGQVPSRNYEEMNRHLELLKASMTRLTSR